MHNFYLYYHITTIYLSIIKDNSIVLHIEYQHYENRDRHYH